MTPDGSRGTGSMIHDRSTPEGFRAMAIPRIARPLCAGLLLATPALALDPGQSCERAASDSLRSCVKRITSLERRCHARTGGACAPDDAAITRASGAVATKVLRRCPDQATVTEAGYPPLMTPTALVDRLQEACGDTAATLVARSFGGPQAAVRTAASTTDRRCLDRAYSKSSSLVAYELHQQTRCIGAVRAGKTCDPASLESRLAEREARTATAIAAGCPRPIEQLVAVDAAGHAARAAQQSRCLVAVAHGNTAPLTLGCGPRAAVPVPPRGTPTQVVLNSAAWGTRCGNGSDYAFWIRLAPAGSPLDRVVVYLQGGGACYAGPDCASQPPTRFDALGEPFPAGGIFDTNNAENPFRDWTIVFLPYCTQDVHIGGGVTNAFPEITVHRFGAINMRTAMSYLRDVLWTALDAADPEGYRGGRITALLTGGSAGGYGDLYNYHWVLDELRWPRTTAAPDSGLGMDNGGPNGVMALGALAARPSSPGWGALPYFAPYCFAPACAEIFDNLEAATALRLKLRPEQQILNISNQVDDVQRDTTNFADTPTFVNTLRANYCSIEGATGIHAFFSAQTATQHTQVSGTKFYSTFVGGTSIAQWLGGAMTSPDAVTDEIAEGTLATDYPGVLPFPCSIGSPRGAFLEGVAGF